VLSALTITCIIIYIYAVKNVYVLIYSYVTLKAQCVSVSLVTRLLAGRPEVQDSIPDRSRDFSLPPPIPDRLLLPLSLLFLQRLADGA
jgi:hypothetical protein